MELYLFIALLFVYAVMSFVVNKRAMRRVWLISYILSFALTGISIAFLRSNHQDALMSVNQMNWYFMLYVFGYIAIALGILNLWIYRKEIWNIVFGKDDDDDIKE